MKILCYNMLLLFCALAAGEEPGFRVREQTLDAIPTNSTFVTFSVNVYEFLVK